MNNFTIQKKGMSKDVPSKIVLYGVPKIGKSRFASQFEDVFFIDVEGGLNYLDKEVDATPTLQNFDDAIAWLQHILNCKDEEFPYKYIAIDSLDWVEALAQEKLIKKHGASSITDNNVKAFAYYKGVMEAASDAIKVIDYLDAIYKKKGIKAILIAHSEIKNMDLPNKDPYSKYILKTSKYLGQKANEWADLILFADYDFYVDKEGKASEPKPVLLAGGSPSFDGGGRMQLPNKIPLNYQSFINELTKEK